MASVRNNLTTKMFACGVDYKRGTSGFALVFGTLSLFLVVIFGITLSEFIEYGKDYKQMEAKLIFGMMLYGTHALSCGLVVMAVKTGCRFLLIPWMIMACVMLALAFRSIWSIISISYLDFSRDSEHNINSPVFQACFNTVIILLFFGFGRCVTKLYKILRAESAVRKLYRQNQRSQPNQTVPDSNRPPPYTENCQPQVHQLNRGNYHPVQNYSIPGLLDPPPPQYDVVVRAQKKSGFNSPPPRYSDVA